MEYEDRIIHRAGNIGIGQYANGWFVCNVGRTGAKARVKGVEVLRDQTFHPTLASACIEAAHRTADQSAARSLTQYAANLRAAIADLGRAVEMATSTSGGVRDTPVAAGGTKVAPPTPANGPTRRRKGAETGARR